MVVLHYSPRACSFAVHVILEEIGAPFELRCTPISEGAHESPEYTRLNPLQRVPLLQTEEGRLTEASAILQYLARRHPEAGLLPADPWLARAQEWLNFLSSSVHPAFGIIFRPHRFADGEDAKAGVEARARARVGELLNHAAKRLDRGPWTLGESFSVVDPYLLVFLSWAERIELPADVLAPFGPFLERVRARPSVQRALARELQG